MRLGWEIKSPEQMEGLAAGLANLGLRLGTVYLLGDLGTGKTTFVRGFLRALGWLGTVKSPTYTLVEPYAWEQYCIYHFDLYRVVDPEELEELGFRDYCDPQALLFIEWPERASDYLSSPDICFEFTARGPKRWVTYQVCADWPDFQKGLSEINV